MKIWVYRLLCLAAIVIVVASIWHVKGNPHDYEECASAAQMAAFDDLMLDASIEAITPARQAQYKQSVIDNQIKCSDLGAQWGMTDIALLGYIAGLLGLVFLGVTVFETQSAATSAKDTLKIARNTLTESKKSTKLEMQPYISIRIKDVKFRDSINVVIDGDNRVQFGFNFTLIIKNLGKTPAENMFINIGSIGNLMMSKGTIDSESYSGRSIEKSNHVSTMGEASLGAGGEVTRKFSCTFYLTEKDIEPFDSDPMKAGGFYALGARVSFRDSFTSNKVFGNFLYERRVYVADFWHFNEKEEVRAAISSLETKAQKVDYPEEHNRKNTFFPHAHYGSGALSVIQLKEDVLNKSS